jgi:hypothetical protein
VRAGRGAGVPERRGAGVPACPSVRVGVCACVCMYVDVYIYMRENRFNKALTLYSEITPYVCGVTKTKYDEKLQRQND